MIIRLKGGLGNQLFGYALGRALEHRGHAIQYETGLLESSPDRRYLLGDMGIKLPIVPLPASCNTIHEGSLRYRSDILELKNESLVLDGYWQSEKYFSDITDDLRSCMFANGNFQISPETYALGCDILNEKACFIHVRRSDNLRPTSTLYHGLTDARNNSYYMRAIEMMRRRIKGVRFYVFSDDAEWIQANMKEPDMVCVTHNQPSFNVNESNNLEKHSHGREVEDLYLMSLCRNAIIANSTFSWWGAWLNRKDGMVISPEPWFSGDTDLDATDIIPDRWHKMSRVIDSHRPYAYGHHGR